MDQKNKKDRLAELDQRIEQLVAKRKLIDQKMKAELRKERSKRLIDTGAFVEHTFKKNDLEENKKMLQDLIKSHQEFNSLKQHLNAKNSHEIKQRFDQLKNAIRKNQGE